MPVLTTLGELASETCSIDEDAAFKAIIMAIDSSFPHNWRDWPVYNYSFESYLVVNKYRLQSKQSYALLYRQWIWPGRLILLLLHYLSVAIVILGLRY